MVQKKKSDEQDVLVVRDEKTGEISVVAGLSRDGTPKRAPAKAENTSDFLRFDRNSDKKMRGSIPCAKDTCHVYQMEESKQYEVVYSFGWYLKKFIQDVREKGATPILVSLTPRNEWPDGKMERRNDSYGKWYREVVAETGVAFLDLHNIAADSYDKIGKEKVKAYYKKDHTHTSLKGAQHNAKCVAKGLKKMKSPLAKYLK